tara:strand:+ start:300 stop:1343 length:1044 start_codon:yes stop_codon:yes gene_type:complete
MINKSRLWSGVAAAAMVSFGVHAQDITMATFGGGVEKTWESAFAQPFTASTGINVKIVPVPSPEAQLRNPAARAQYDVALVTYPQAANLLRDGLIQTFSGAELPDTADTNAKYLMKDKDGKLAGASPYFMYYAIAFNSTQASKSDFQSWSDLANPKWKGKLALTRPIYISSYDLPIMAIAQGGSEKDIEPGVELLKKIAPNVLTQYSSIAHMNGLLTRGEIAAGPYYSGRVWQIRREGAKDVDITIPKEGALMIPYIVVVPKSSKNLTAVKKWLGFMSTAQPQVRALELGGYFPLNQDAEMPPEMQKEMGFTMKQLLSKLHQPDWSVIAAADRDRTNLAEKVIAGVK